MTFDWILHPLAMYGSILVCLYVVLSTRMEVSDVRKQSAQELERLSKQVAALTAELEKKAAEPAPAPLPIPTPQRAMNINQRTEALRMSRRGHQAHTIAAALGLPAAEVSLLQTVQTLLDREDRRN
jgi:hypothetical protein